MGCRFYRTNKESLWCDAHFLRCCDQPRFVPVVEELLTSMLRNPRGLLRHSRVSEQSRFQLQRCIELAGRITNELEIDLATWLSAVHLQSNTEPLPKEGIKLEPRTSDIARAVIEVLTDRHLIREQGVSRGRLFRKCLHALVRRAGALLSQRLRLVQRRVCSTGGCVMAPLFLSPRRFDLWETKSFALI